MFGLADLKKLNERASEKGRHSTDGFRSIRRNGLEIAIAGHSAMAQEIADALNLADAVAEANANAVGRT